MSIEPIIAENKEQIDYNPIYKVNQIVDGVINAVYVFYGQPSFNEGGEGQTTQRNHSVGFQL